MAPKLVFPARRHFALNRNSVCSIWKNLAKKPHYASRKLQLKCENIVTVRCKVKVKLSLCLTKHLAMKTYWGIGGIVPQFLTSALDGGEGSVSLPGRFIPRERAHGTHWIGGWVGPRAVLDAAKKKFPSQYIYIYICVCVYCFKLFIWSWGKSAMLGSYVHAQLWILHKITM
jgi:hypothetical protein